MDFKEAYMIEYNAMERGGSSEEHLMPLNPIVIGQCLDCKFLNTKTDECDHEYTGYLGYEFKIQPEKDFGCSKWIKDTTGKEDL